MRFFLLLIFVVPAFADGGAPADRLIGFTDEGSSSQLELEQKFDELLEPDNLRQRMKLLSARPHHVGSPYGKTNAHWIAEQFRSWGFDTRIEVFHVLFPTPTLRRLELLEPRRFRASLVEPALAEDTTSALQSERLPPYNAYSIDGDVTAPLVYVNYGLPEDYDELERRGIDVTGMIVIARYGRSWRGIKPKVAAENGAVGCILYSDPRDDGYVQGDVYPGGAFKNEAGVQRGSVADMPLYPGDPLTPFVGATKDAERLDLTEARTLTRIPVLPVSYGDARPLLEALEGPVAPGEWRGGLPITYHLGPGPAKVRLQLEFSWDTVVAYDVIARLPGSERSDVWILRGNHHDAWVNGANDPVSGLVALMEEARAVGELARGGWRPRRTLMYAAWDAEEPGLIGSVEWVEAHAGVLNDNAAIYINSDSNGRGFLYAGGSHTLEAFFNQVAQDVTDPQTGLSVAARARALRMVRGNGEVDDTLQMRLGALGSGSDYTPFLQHLGIASLNVGFGGENRGGEYHSTYDSFDHYSRFGDPGFEYGVALAQTNGRLMLRLANADRLPLRFAPFSRTVSGYVDELAELVDGMRQRTEAENRLIGEGLYAAAADPQQRFVPPEPQPPVPHLNFAPLHNVIARLTDSAAAYDLAAERLESSGRSLPQAEAAELDRLLLGMERRLTREPGLAGRPWFRHHLYAPGFYTGYGVKTLPGVREAIEQREWDTAESQVAIAAEVLESFAAQIDRATQLVASAMLEE